jgi:putative membrane protein
MLIRPILVILTLPITILTLGLFILVINGLLFYAIAYLISGFDVQTLGAGIIGALVYSVISWILSALLIKD